MLISKKNITLYIFVLYNSLDKYIFFIPYSMLFIISLFSLISSDNYILSKKDFHTLQIAHNNYFSEDLHSNEYYKISFPGIFCYKLIRSNNIIRLVDHTIYLKQGEYSLQLLVTKEEMWKNISKETLKISLCILVLFISAIIPYILIYIFKSKIHEKIKNK